MADDAMARENASLRARLEEAEAALDAIRSGEVDAILVSGAKGQRVYTLEGADEAYRLMVEQMREGALTLDPAGVVLYCNPQFARLVGRAPESILGTHFRGIVAAEDADHYDRLLEGVSERPVKADIRLASSEGPRATQLTIGALEMRGMRGMVVVATDLTEERARTVTKKLVRRILGTLAARDPQTPAKRRELGRTIAAEIEASEMAPFFSAFHSMGLGELTLAKSEHGRFIFHGNDMLDRVSTSATPTCHLPLGFVEGIVSALTHAPVLGTEVECQSQGRERCVFVARASVADAHGPHADKPRPS